jgi:hypothetical protein
MNLSNLIDGFEVPACLKRRLVFGDVEQIEALKRLELEIEKEEREQSNIDEGNLKEYDVTIQFSGEATIRVWAESEKDAEKMARDDPGDPDEMEVDYVSARRAPNKRNN